ncbi:MAG TPA: peptidyl-prolyl cis-trans isomerase [Thermoanaerobaculia bacterium]|nr:peptidyl-prolyl cis-trans isomerase [Thermoanaerobaculia bacterium]
MKRTLISLALAAVAAVPLFGQGVAPASDGEKVVATVNGEAITKAHVDRLWNRMSAKMRGNYEKTGGKRAFLDNYLRKRLLLQKAVAAGYDKSPEVQAELEAARESALFDLYVRDVVSATVIDEAAIRKFYDENPNNFAQPARAKVRLILVGTENRPRSEAQEVVSTLLQELFPLRANPAGLADAFTKTAAAHSDHPSNAQGGDLGWVDRSMLDRKIADAVFSMKRGMMSGVIESDAGLHVVLVEDHQPAQTVSYEDARGTIREYLMGANAQKVLESVNRTTTELRNTGKVTVYPENLE